MPRPLKTWGCDFRCGYTNSKESRVAAHEKHCFLNPAVRACRICRHNLLDREEIGCLRDDAEDLLQGQKARIGCPAWEPMPCP